MDDIPWIYVAMIFIAFISWLRGRIQDASAARRERMAERKAQEHARRATEPEYESPYTAKSRTPEPESPQTFTDIIREIERQISEPEGPEPVREVEPAPSPQAGGPPPLPSSQPTYQSAAELPVPVTPSPLLAKRKKKRTSRKKTELSKELTLISALSSGNQLRTALVLKEVLDKPRALQPRRVKPF